MLGLSLLLSLSLPTPPVDKWGPLREQLDGWVLTDNFAVTIGDATGPLFEYAHGNFTLDRLVGTASTSKWPLAMMFVGLVADGTIRSLDAKASEYVSWWATEAGDLKSQVTLRQLLSFTSGFGTGAPGQGNSSEMCMGSSASGLDYDDCAQQVYLATNLSGTPGKSYTYNSVHLQLAGAVAMAASGLGIQVRRRRCTMSPGSSVGTRSTHRLADQCRASFLLGLQPHPSPAHRKSSTSTFWSRTAWSTPAAPTRHLPTRSWQSACRLPASTTSNSSSAHSHTACCPRSSSTRRRPTTRHSCPTGTPSTVREQRKQHKTFLRVWLADLTPSLPVRTGNYGFGHFLECFDSVDGFTPACRDAAIHSDPGAYGFYPLIDRKRNFYMQIVAYEIGKVAYPRSGIPEYLRLLVKPLADAVLAGETGLDDAFAHHTPRLSGVSLADVNYMAGCYIHPENCA
jgi:hypothetical protein